MLLFIFRCFLAKSFYHRISCKFQWISQLGVYITSLHNWPLGPVLLINFHSPNQWQFNSNKNLSYTSTCIFFDEFSSPMQSGRHPFYHKVAIKTNLYINYLEISWVFSNVFLSLKQKPKIIVLIEKLSTNGYTDYFYR